jgi:hypothetical protein
VRKQNKQYAKVGRIKGKLLMVVVAGARSADEMGFTGVVWCCTTGCQQWLAQLVMCMVN